MHDDALITTIAAGFGAAWVLGLLTQRIGLSPIVGYLLAGVAIGRYTPGYVGDPDVAKQLAEIGVILLMFGVGLHFHLKDLLAVKSIAVPGAVGQSLAATIVTMIVFYSLGWPLRSGVVLGMAMSVASTVVLLRVLMDRDMLSSIHGHVAVGWLIVEDIFTVLVLVIIPMIGVAAVDSATTMPATAAHVDPATGLVSAAWAIGKLVLLIAIVFLAGSRIVPWVLVRVSKLRSQELFTLTVLVVSITVAVISAQVFGASVALGAFLAGMVVGQSPVSHQAASDALPMRDAFAVLFFVSVGMLFDPRFLIQEPLMVAAALGIVLLVKPAAAMVIVAIVGYPARTALTVAIGLAQIGEFSFILAEVSRKYGLLPTEGHHVLVATSIISITLNPILFRSLDRYERWLQRWPWAWKVLNARATARVIAINDAAAKQIAASAKPFAIIVGYGPVGRVVDALLRDSGLDSVIIDLNMDTVESLSKRGRTVIFGDGSRMGILEQAGIKQSSHLVITLPHSSAREPLVLAARQLNPSIEITVRARYMGEREALRKAGATTTVVEEGEVGIALARHVLRKTGVDQATMDKMLLALRRIWNLQE
jgi:monovalent cation:H+ antiporter-2, CPA2 family